MTAFCFPRKVMLTSFWISQKRVFLCSDEVVPWRAKEGWVFLYCHLALCVSPLPLSVVAVSSQKLLQHSHIPIHLYFVEKKWIESKFKKQKFWIHVWKKPKQLESVQQKLPRKQAVAQIMGGRFLFNTVCLIYCPNSKPDTVGKTNTHYKQTSFWIWVQKSSTECWQTTH